MLDDLEKLKNNPPQPTEFSKVLAAKASAKAVKAHTTFTALVTAGIVAVIAAIIAVAAILVPSAEQNEISSPALPPTASSETTPSRAPSQTPASPSASSTPTPSAAPSPTAEPEPTQAPNPPATSEATALPTHAVALCQGSYEGFAIFENDEFKVGVQFTNEGSRCVTPDSQVDFTIRYSDSRTETFTRSWQSREIAANGSSWLTQSMFASNGCDEFNQAIIEISVDGNRLDDVLFTCPIR